jgi:PPOX class probable F420-dependent enzyme
LSSDLTPAVREFLDGPGHFAVVATVNADGTPHQAVVWYARQGEDVVVNARDGRRWAANARRDCCMSVTVAEAYDYVILTGPVDVVDDPEQAAAGIRSLARRYRDDEDQFAGQARVGFVLHPAHVAVHGRLVAQKD